MAVNLGLEGVRPEARMAVNLGLEGVRPEARMAVNLGLEGVRPEAGCGQGENGSPDADYDWYGQPFIGP
jgi:hypothetical protein